MEPSMKYVHAQNSEIVNVVDGGYEYTGIYILQDY